MFMMEEDAESARFMVAVAVEQNQSIGYGPLMSVAQSGMIETNRCRIGLARTVKGADKEFGY